LYKIKWDKVLFNLKIGNRIEAFGELQRIQVCIKPLKIMFKCLIAMEDDLDEIEDIDDFDEFDLLNVQPN
jgi:hypothetical protein